MTDKKITLLVVDDDKAICTMMVNVLSAMNYDVLTAKSGEDALELAKNNSIEVALVDIGLPGISGIELTRNIIKETNMIVLLMTGDDVTYSYEVAVEAGAMDFIAKPIRLSELPLRIERARELRDAVESKNVLISELEKLATVDELTQLQNARQFHSRLESEVERARRYNRPLSLVLLDIDHFKKVNDTFGHPTGDVVLQSVAGVMSEKSRSSDNVFRYGGEEFAFILPETTIEQAVFMAERVRTGVEELTVIDGHEMRITICAGVGMFDNSGKSSDFIRRVDAALYRAKNQGRNRVVSDE